MDGITPQTTKMLADLADLVPQPAMVIDRARGRIAAVNRAGTLSGLPGPSSGMAVHLPLRLSPDTDLHARGLDAETGPVTFSEEMIEGANETLRVATVTDACAVLIATTRHPLAPAAAGKSSSPLPSDRPPSGAVTSVPELQLAYSCEPERTRRVYTEPERLVDLGLVGELAEVATMDWREAVEPGRRVDVQEAIESVLAVGGGRALSYGVKTVSGGTIGVREYINAVTLSDGQTRLVGHVVNADASYDRVLQFERLALVGRFVGGMVHDFRNLVTGIHTMLEWCLREAQDGTGLHAAIDETLGYTRHASELMRNTLDFIGGDDPPSARSVQLGDLINGLTPLIRCAISASIRLDTVIEDNLPSVLVEPRRFQDMLLNLCLNARDAMRERGDCLQLRLSRVCSSNTSSGPALDDVVLLVRDNGCGMPPDQLETVFDAFFSTKTGGVGLGLWTVRNTIRDSNGKLTVRSKLGQGTEFEIRFPGHDRTTSPTQTAVSQGQHHFTAPHEAMPAGTILLVEDEGLVRASLSRQLTSMGFEVLSAEDGTVAWQTFEENRSRIDLILQDFIIPGKRGDELLVDFHRESPEIPVVVISAFPDTASFPALKEKGAYAVLPKPFEMSELRALIREALKTKPDKSSR